MARHLAVFCVAVLAAADSGTGWTWLRRRSRLGGGWNWPALP